MPIKKLILLIVLSIASLPSIAETRHDWTGILQKNKCNYGEAGFFLWDSKKCLLDGRTLLIDGKKYQLKKEESHVDIKIQHKGLTSAGDKYLETYSGDGFILKLTLTYLPGCYGDEQCTFSSYFAEFEVIYTDNTKKPLKYQGVGYEGS
jgi:hypothetical protein